MPRAHANGGASEPPPPADRPASVAPRAPSEPPSQAARAGGAKSPSGEGKSRGIEIEYVREGDMDRVRDPFLEVWTRNHVYLVDDDWTCVGVLDPATRKLEPKHHFLGAKMSGGQRVSKTHGTVEIVYPFPVPGTEAVFRYPNQRGVHGQYGLTSKVERVLLRIRKYRGTINPQARPEEQTGLFQVR